MKSLFAALLLLSLPTFALAEFSPLSDKSRFLSMIDGKTLSNRLFGVELSVLPDGTIRGEAQGWPITGTWQWQNGFFCREMDWDGYAIGYNCQLVETRGNDELRFTVDQGAGRSARFKLR